MPKITDTEPIEIDGKRLYDNELDRVKKMYGFKPPYSKDIGDPEEYARFSLIREKRKINRAK